MIKNCPYCKQEFECKNDDILNCDCTWIPLSPETRQFIAKHFDDCLCVNCLKKIEKIFEEKKTVVLMEKELKLRV